MRIFPPYSIIAAATNRVDMVSSNKKNPAVAGFSGSHGTGNSVCQGKPQGIVQLGVFSRFLLDPCHQIVEFEDVRIDFGDPLGADKTGTIIGCVHGRDDHPAVTGRGVNHSVVTEVNPHMRWIRGIGPEKNQIPLLEATGGNFIANFELFPGCSGERDLKFAENLLDKAGTVNAAPA